jgi:hypothetical protein
MKEIKLLEKTQTIAQKDDKWGVKTQYRTGWVVWNTHFQEIYPQPTNPEEKEETKPDHWQVADHFYEEYAISSEALVMLSALAPAEDEDADFVIDKFQSIIDQKETMLVKMAKEVGFSKNNFFEVLHKRLQEKYTEKY